MWILADDEQSVLKNGHRILQRLPKVICAQLLNDKGNNLPGLIEKGLYLITPRNDMWYLDKGRSRPVLKITRTQLPLTPAYAMTAHASQGQTFGQGTIIDFTLGGSSSGMSSYVALTRVQRRSVLLILWPHSQGHCHRGQTQVWNCC